MHIVLSNLRLNKKIGNEYDRAKKYSNEIKETIDVLLTRQIDGIIYIGEHPRNVNSIISDVNKPLVYSYCYNSKKESYSVNYNDKRAAYQAVEFLINSGHQKIAVISGMNNSRSSLKRLKGYQKALQDNGISPDTDLIKNGNWEYDSGYSLGRELLQKKERPTALFAFNDLMAVGAIDGAESLGFKVPEDLSIIGFDNREFSRFSKPALTTMDLPLTEMGEKAAETLVKLINEEEIEFKDISLECSLIKRDSVKNLSFN